MSRCLVFLLVLVAVCGRVLPAPQNGQSLRTLVIRPDVTDPVRAIPPILPHGEVRGPTVGLVLSGGGARGLASVGVLEAFEENNIPIDFITGTSIGSIIGGLYAAGYSVDQLKALVDTTNWEEILSLSDEARRRDMFYDQKLSEDKSVLVLRFDGFEPVLPEAFSTGQRLTQYLNVLSLQAIYHPTPSFDDLRIPFRAVATDLVSGKRVVIGEGDLAEALRASVSVPLLFHTVKKDTTQLLDGGLTSNIPADVARSWGADIVVAVDVTSPLRPAEKLNAPWEIADQIIGISMQLAKKEQLRNADYVIRPGIGDHLSTEFNGLDSLIRLGREEGSKILAAVKVDLARRANNDQHRRSFSFPSFFYDAELLHSWKDQLQAVVVSDSVDDLTLKTLVTEIYASGNFESVQCVIDEYPGRTEIRLDVQRNPVLTGVDILGTAVLSADTLAEVFSELIGQPLNFFSAQRALERVLKEYRDGGYSLATIDSVTFDRLSGRATVLIDEGVVYRRTIVGTTKTKDYVIWRELPWSQGDVFRVDKVAEGLSNLYGTTLFEQVSINIRREGEKNRRKVVIINVRERYTDLVRLGILINNERNVQPSIDMRDENFLGIGSEIGVQFFGGLRNRAYLGEFKASRIFNSYLTFGLRGYYNLKDINVFKDEPLVSPTRWNRVRDGEYREVREGLSMSFGTQLERLGQVILQGRIEHQRHWSIFSQPVASESFRVNALRIGAKVDSRDRFPYPRDGVMMEFFYESGVVTVPERQGFNKMFFDYRWYNTPFSRQTLRPRITVGFGDETVPLTEHFTLGGEENFYGFREDNARGRQLFLVSLEYRYFLPIRVLFDTYLGVRYDLGNIWGKVEQIRIKDLRHGIGLFLAFDTPIGPAQISVGRAFFIRKDLFDSPLSYGPTLSYFKLGYAF